MISKAELEFNKNDDFNRLAVSELNRKLQTVYMGGGAKRIEAHKAKGKLTARERIAQLTDLGSTFMEIGALVADGMYEEEGGCPSGGVVTGVGRIEGRLCVIVANDATVKAGAWFPITAKKNLRAQEISIENKLPIIYLVDSAGIYLPLQAEVFADKEHFGRVFRNNAIMSSMGIVQIAAIMGSCVAGGAYLPIMSDEAMIVDGTGSVFLAGSFLVKSAIGEDVDNETLGGATTHCEISGVTDYKMPDDVTCLKTIRSIVSKMGYNQKAGFNRVQPKLPKISTDRIFGILPADKTKPYDMKEVIKCLVDDSELDEYKALYGKTIICGLARIDGWAVGIVANQRSIVKSGKGEMQLGGVIYSDSADKAARFIMNCNQKKIPLLFLQDVTGFMVGSRSEHGGIIKDGAKMVSAVSNSVVPKFTIYIGNSYGAGNYAMCGKAYDPRFIFAWPSATIAVMSGNSAANTLLQIEKAKYAARKEELSKEEEKALLDKILKQYNDTASPYYAASRLWVDGIINPLHTRELLSICIEAADNAPITKVFNPGIIQT
jgi:acetyl-CoA carboxylase carboxyltransferase component